MANSPYRGYSANPLAAIEKRQYVTTKNLVKGLKLSLANIKAEIASAKNPAYADSQRKLYDAIAATYAKLGASVDKYLKDDVAAAAALGGAAVAKDAAGADLVRWSEARCKRYWRYVTPQAGKNLAAVYTEKMAEDTILALRQSVVDVERRAAIEGMSMKEKHKAILQSWNGLTGDDSNFQFVDRSGKAWDNARYIQMLTRTTAQRVYRDAYVDRLAESGFKLARVVSTGAADCPACKAWQGVICLIAGKSGKYPTIEEARNSGVFHPNCLCTLEYVDDDLDATDIENQAKAGKVDWDDAEAVQHRTDEIALANYRAEGMDAGEAEDALTRAKVEEALRAGLFTEDSEAIAAGLSHEQLAKFREDGIPEFALTKGRQEPGWNHGANGGKIYVKRGDVLDSVTSILDVEPKAKPWPKPKVDVEDSGRLFSNGVRDAGKAVAQLDIMVEQSVENKSMEFPANAADAELARMKAALEQARKNASDGKRPTLEKLEKNCRDAEAAIEKARTEHIKHVIEHDIHPKFPKWAANRKAVFDNADVRIIDKVGQSLAKIEATRGGAYCVRGTVYITKNRDSWNGNDTTLSHETGHTIWNKIMAQSTQEHREKLECEIIEAATSDFAEVKKLFEKDVNGKPQIKGNGPGGRVFYGDFMAKITGKAASDYNNLDVSGQYAWAALCDICSAVDSRFYGHSKSYYSSTYLKAHEIVANSFAAIVSGNTELDKRFPKTAKIVRSRVLGFPEKVAEKAQ